MKRKNKTSKILIVCSIIMAVTAAEFLVYDSSSRREKIDIAPLPEIFIDSNIRMSREDTINAMALAFAKQESNFDHMAVSPCGRCFGCLQISEIMVREANRIVGFDCFCYDDRYDRQGSYAIFRIIQEHKNPKLEIDKAIDLWNPRCGQVYRAAVKKYFEYNLQNYNTLHNYYEI